ncbi:hypothetical protein ACQ86N_00795 [Puia sp. P3]|uniref:hypothetical protein n=1 Tax=Puia sp. P3 TaxID=3423952 RepID=UPI003D66A3DF
MVSAPEIFDHDGLTDLLIGGNFYESKPEAGIYDAGYGLFLKGKWERGFYAAAGRESGFFVQ